MQSIARIARSSFGKLAEKCKNNFGFGGTSQENDILAKT